MKEPEKENKPVAIASFVQGHLSLTRQGSIDGRLSEPKKQQMVAEKTFNHGKNEAPGTSTELMTPSMYLLSPIKTLIYSIDFPSQISRHDILEAYNTLALRLKSLVPSPECHDATPLPMPALEPLTVNAYILSQALKRDIECALLNPLSFPATSTSSLHWYSGYQEQDSMWRTQSEVQLMPDDIQRAQESILICHNALKVLSLLLHTAFFHQAFEACDLTSLFKSTLSLYSRAELPTPSTQKTQALVIWILKTQDLPSTILGADVVRFEIVRVLRDVLSGGEQSEKMIGDAFEAFKNILSSNSSAFLAPLSEILSCVLKYLVSPSNCLRFKAADVLGVFNTLLLGASDGDSQLPIRKNRKEAEINHARIWDLCATSVRSFIDLQCARRSTVPGEHRLLHILTTALSTSTNKLNSNPASHPAQAQSNAAWAIHTLLSLIIHSSSSSHSPFTHPRSVRLFIPLLGEAIRSRRKDVRRAGDRGWKVLVWSFWKLCYENADAERDDDMEERAFKVVKQELGGGIGELLIRALLQNGGEAEEVHSGSGLRSQALVGNLPSIRRALAVLSDMIQNSRKSVAKEGLELLSKLVNGIGDSVSLPQPRRWSLSHALPRVLFTGLSLSTNLNVDSKPEDMFSIKNLRQLTEEEIECEWDTIMRSWVIGVRRFLVEEELEGEPEMRKEVSNYLLQIWQSLLLVKAQLTQGHGHLTTHTEFAQRAASLVSAFLIPQSSPPAVLAVGAQQNSLRIVLQLWRVMKNVYVSSWLSTPAKHILGEVFKLKWDTEDVNVKNAWDALTKDLSTVGELLLLDILDDNEDGKDIEDAGTRIGQPKAPGRTRLEVQLKRQLWDVLAKPCKSHKQLRWEDVVRFLAVPFGAWTMSDGEIVLWGEMLQCAIAAAVFVDIRPAIVIQEVLQKMGDRRVDKSSRFIEMTSTLLSRLDISATSPLPADVLSMVDDILLHLYPPPLEDIHVCLHLICTLKAIIIAAPLSLLVPILASVQSGLCLWIEDKLESVPEVEYNDKIISIYIDSLVKLRNHTPSVETLNSLAPFFTSAFWRMPPPALGPLAFETFWKATYHEKPELLRHIPEKLKASIKGFDDAFGGGLTAGWSHDTESQITVASSAPDSEPSRVVRCHNGQQSARGSQQSTPRSTAKGAEAEDGLLSSPISLQYEVAVDSSSIMQNLQLLMPAAHTNTSQLLVESAISQLGGCSSPAKSHLGHQSSHSETLEYHEMQIHQSGAYLRSQMTPSGRSLKRLGDIISSIPKRAKTQPELSSSQDMSRILSDTMTGPFAVVSPNKRTLNLKSVPLKAAKSLLEPMSRVMSPIRPSCSSAETALARRTMRFDGVEVPTYQQVLARQRKEQMFSLMTWEEPNLESTSTSSDDFDSWEAELDVSDLQSLRSGDISVPDTEMWDTSEVEPQRSTSPISAGPTINNTSLTRHSKSHSTTHVLPKLRQPGLLRARTTSDSLGLMREVYDFVKDDASQLPEEVLVQASRMAHEMGAVLSAQMGRRLGSVHPSPQ